MRWTFPRPRRPRRGVTLVEMLVVVALLVLMMTIIVQIFQAATASVSAAKVYQGLDDELRELDATIRKDLQGATARFNPPLDPDDNLGYFEYIENSWADAQGEDIDDCLRFTAQAPPGQPFVGRMYLAPLAGTANFTAAQLANSQPVLITSEYAEIIYFLRNGNLYRRVLLVAPDRQAAVHHVYQQTGALATVQAGQAPTFSTALFNGTLGNGLFPGTDQVSWLGVNDLSARPAPRGPTPPERFGVEPILNTLGDLTNRENRAFTPRFSDDYQGPQNGPDGLADDFNQGVNGISGDGVPDYYPTLYPNVFNVTFTDVNNIQHPLINSFGYPLTLVAPTHDNLAFPYVFPGATSKVDPNSLGTGLGWIHVPDPTQTAQGQAGTAYNHAPVDVGDSLPVPSAAGQTQTWYGLPTWRETMSLNWLDPVKQLNQPLKMPVGTTFSGTTIAAGNQPLGLQQYLPTVNPSAATTPSPGNLLPPASLWFNPQPYNDGSGTSSAFLNVYQTSGNVPQLVQSVWEDDLLMTGVRSFDVKAYDNSVSSYVDLGNNPNNATPFSNILNLPIGTGANPTQYNITGGFSTLVQDFGQAYALYLISSSLSHEGVIPPRPADFRFDPQALALGIPIPLGDSFTTTTRLRRTWDTWSTEYTEAPASGYDPSQGTLPPYGLGVYPPAFPLFSDQQASGLIPSNPVYPSYPPPYPVPLRGVQIQVRVVDPRNERVKVITIRQDFSDKISTLQQQ